MHPNQEPVTTEAVGQALGELLGSFVTVINILRRQPGFQDELFRGELQELVKEPNLTTLQLHTFNLLLQTPQASPEADGTGTIG